MWPLELPAPPAGSPRCRSGGGLKKAGADLERISGGCWAKRGAATIKNKKRERFMGLSLITPCRIIHAFEDSVARQGFVLGFSEGDDGEAADADERRITEEFVGFDLS